MGGILLKERNVAFIHIPKTGGQSVREWLKKEKDFNIMPLNQRNIDVKHPTYDLIKKHYGEENIDFTFAVIRNPYARAQSLYKHLNRVSVDFKKNKISFEDFIFDEDRYENTALKPQSTWFGKKDNVHIIRFENFNDEFKYIIKMLNRKDGLPRKNASSKPRHDRVEYTSEMKKFLYNKTKEDFIRFGYEK